MPHYDIYADLENNLLTCDIIYNLNKCFEKLNVLNGDFMAFQDTKGNLKYYSNEFFDWDNYERCMISISEENPNITFIVHSTGYKIDDWWYHLFKNGKSEKLKASIVFPQPIKADFLQYRNKQNIFI